MAFISTETFLRARRAATAGLGRASRWAASVTVVLPLLTSTPAGARGPEDGPTAASLAERGRAGLEAIRPEAISSDVRFLADDLLEGRAPATRGHLLAERYVAARLAALGLEPAGKDGTFFQVVPLRRLQPVAGSTALEVRCPRGPLRFREGEDHVAVVTDVKSARIAAPLVFAGYGVVAPEYGWNDLEGVDVRGKIAVVLAGAPPGEGEFFPPLPRAAYAAEKFDGLADAGAAAVIVVRTPEIEVAQPWKRAVLASRLPRVVWLGDDGRAGRAAARLPRVQLQRAAFDRLLACAGAGTTTDALIAAAGRRERPRVTLPPTGLLSVRTVNTDVQAANVIARLPGSDPTLRRESVLYTAHLDHLGVGPPVSGDGVYNGAVDNASGVATVLSVAAAFAALPVKPARSVVFALVTGEESGFVGSDYLAGNPLPDHAVVADVNVDGVLPLVPLTEVVAVGADHSSLGRNVDAAASALGLGVGPDFTKEQFAFIRSDQLSFVRRGVPSVFFLAGLRGADGGRSAGKALFDRWFAERYHTPHDEWTPAWDWPSTAAFARAAFLVGLSVANDPDRPRWNPGDFFERWRPGASEHVERR